MDEDLRARLERYFAARERRGRDVDAAWRAVSGRMRASARPTLPRARWWLAAAAAMVLVAGGVTLWRLSSRTTLDRTPSELATAVGHRGRFDLPDGSRVILGPGSRLRYAGQFVDARDVELEGEAYFRVTPDAARRFTVRTGLVISEVLGTEFTVRAYAETRAVAVAVASGSVAVRAAASGRASTLQPGDVAHVDSAGALAVAREDLAPYVAWTEGRLAFDATPLDVVLPRLARWYGLTFEARGTELRQRRFTARFADDELGSVLSALALALDARVTHHGDTILLEPAK